MKKRTLKTKYPVFLSLIFQTMREIWCIYWTRTEQESMLRKLLLNKQKQNKNKTNKKAQNNLKIYSRYLQNWTGIVIGNDLSVKCTLKSKQSQPSPPILSTESYGYALTGRVERLSANHARYPLAVVSLGRSRQVSQKLRLSTGGNPWKIITGSDWQPGTLKTPSEYCRRAFYALSRHFPSTFWIPKKNGNYRGVHDALRRRTFTYVNCTISVPFVDSSSI